MANGGGGQILHFLWKGEIRKGWRNQRKDLGIAGACLLADSRSSATLMGSTTQDCVLMWERGHVQDLDRMEILKSL